MLLVRKRANKLTKFLFGIIAYLDSRLKYFNYIFLNEAKFINNWYI